MTDDPGKTGEDPGRTGEDPGKTGADPGRRRRLPVAASVALILLGVPLLAGGSCFGLVGLTATIQGNYWLLLMGVVGLAVGIAAIVFAARRM